VSDSLTTYTFYLDENATFSDGTKVTPEDVHASLISAISSKIYSGRFYRVLNVLVQEDGGITIDLDTAYENFPLLLDVPILKASQQIENYPLGTGPYALSEGLSGKQLYRVANWWCRGTEVPVRADTVPLVEATSDSAVRDEFEFGDVGLVCTNPLLGSYADYRCDFEMWEVDNGVFLYIGCNVLYSDYFKDNDTLRKALTYAIDRETLNEKHYRGGGKVSTIAASPMSPYYSESLASRYSYDPMKFIDLMSGWKPPAKEEGAKEERKLKLLVNCDDSSRLRTARDIARTLTELGIPCGTLEYSGNTHPTYQEVLSAGTYDIYLG
jgi:peptide/nickel transport system substrate-binding protein